MVKFGIGLLVGVVLVLLRNWSQDRKYKRMFFAMGRDLADRERRRKPDWSPPRPREPEPPTPPAQINLSGRTIGKSTLQVSQVAKLLETADVMIYGPKQEHFRELLDRAGIKYVIEIDRTVVRRTDNPKLAKGEQ
jgi:hypothetical protein